MGTELILIRHGHAVRVNGDYLHAPLTTLGRQQATQTGQHLSQQHQPLEGFYTSPLRRARETAAIIETQMGQISKVAANLREMELIELPALALCELFSAWDPVERYLYAHAGKPMRWPLQGRVSSVLTEIVSMHPDGRVVVVAHSGVISAALAWFFPQQRLHWWISRVGNCSLTRLQVDGAQAELFAADETQHLTPVLATTQPPSRTMRVAARALRTRAEAIQKTQTGFPRH